MWDQIFSRLYTTVNSFLNTSVEIWGDSLMTATKILCKNLKSPFNNKVLFNLATIRLLNMSYQNEDLKLCSDKRQNSFKGLKLKLCKFLQPFFTSCEHDTKTLSF